MIELSLSDALEQGLRHQQRGNLAQAEAIYRRILEVFPDQPDALHLLGVLAHEVRQYGQAIDLISRAIAIRGGGVADYHHNLARALEASNRTDDAIAEYQRTVQLRPGLAEAFNSLGALLHLRGRLEEAAEAFVRATELRPDYIVAQNNLAETRRLQGRLPEAEARFRRTIALNPRLAAAHHGLGNVLQRQSRFAEAIAAYRTVVVLDANHADAWANLGLLLSASHQTLDEAIACLRRAVTLNPRLSDAFDALGHALLRSHQREAAAEAFARVAELLPDHAPAWNNMAVINYMMHGRLDAAVAACEKALALDPDMPAARNNLGNTLLAQGRVEEAIEQYRRAVELRPAGGSAHSNLLLAMHYLPQYSPPQIFAETMAWAKRQAEPIYPSIKPHVNDHDPDRRLRLGYLSQDFRHHPVATFLLPIFAAHDHSQFEISCYSAVNESDVCTERFMQVADHWHDVAMIDDAHTADLIRGHRIDILVDLSGHIASNRLLVFAHKPAPVQVTYLGYPDTTGMTTMDYRLTDARHDPPPAPRAVEPGVNEQYYTERLVRLPDTAWCFEPWDAHEVSPLPARSLGRVTFASLNNIPKITPQVIECWSRILHAVKDSTLMLIVHSEGLTPRRLREQFAAHGIAAQRLTIFPRRGHDEYIQLFKQIDLSLDTFPYNGHTTTCNSLWMGVPVVALDGDTHVSRAGVSVLTTVGVPQFIAKSIDQYVDLAIRWASDLDALAKVRGELRERMKQSPLMDPKRFTRNLESAYREMWRRWCVAAGAAGH